MTATAQPVFRAEDLPGQPGDYYRTHVRTNVDLSTLLGTEGGPQTWDFSTFAQPGASEHRIDVLPAAEGGHGAAFEAAGYVERDTNQGSGAIGWSYFRQEVGVGRLYYGYVLPEAEGADSRLPFDEPTVDVPAEVRWGKSWDRTADFGFIQQGIPVRVLFTDHSEVDAFGAIVLPGIGSREALRVREQHVYVSSLLHEGQWLAVAWQTNSTFTWFVPGLGVAAQAIVLGTPSYSATPRPDTNVVSCTFASSKAPVRVPVARLEIELVGPTVVLAWDEAEGAAGYEVEATPALGPTEWTLVAAPVTVGWSTSVTSAQRFFRVFAK